MLEDAKQWKAALEEYVMAQRLSRVVKTDSNNLQNNVWRYIDPHGNPYALTGMDRDVASDINRVRATMRTASSQK